jgi:nucleoside-diphosphate-sugar epimerase
MQVAITGADGFLGRALAARLPGARTTDLATLDVRGPVDAMSTAFAGCDVVVHLAALTGVAPSLDRPDEYRRTNTDGTAAVVAACEAAGVRRRVVTSSSSVYGECPAPAVEGRTPLRPLSPYGESKVGAEAAVRAATGTSMERVIVRPFTVYGPGQRPDMLVARLLAGEPGLRLFPFVRDLTYVDEVVDGLVAALDVALPTAAAGAGPLVCNLGSGRPVAAVELLDALAVVTGRRPEVGWIDRRAGEPVRTEADPSRARRLLGVPPPIDLVVGLARQREYQRTVAWVR